MSNVLLNGAVVLCVTKDHKREGVIPTDKPDTQTPILDDCQARVEPPLSTHAAEVDSLPLSADRSLTRSQSLPQEATRPLEGQADEPSPQPDLKQKPDGRPKQQQQPRSPPPNTLWNTPRASDRCTHILNVYQLSLYYDVKAIKD